MKVQMRKKIAQSPWILIVIWGILYFPGFFAAGHLREPAYVIHMRLDDFIPFSEWFLIPYCFWFAWVPGMLLYYMRKEKREYFELSFVMFTGMLLSVVFYLFFPNHLDFRVPVEERNVLCSMVNCLYAIDPPTNAFPSIHVGSTVAIYLVTAGSARMRRRKGLQCGALIITVLICLATVMLKQHSAADVFSGAGLSLVLYLLFCKTKKGRAFLDGFL